MNRFYILSLLGILSLFLACETEYIPDIPNDEPDIVVEGYIEAGPNARPPYVLLTQSTPFFSTINAEALNDLFVHDAVVTISDGTNTIPLTEVCYNDLSPAQQELVGEALGLGEADSIGLNICVYIEANLAPALGEVGKSYDLRIELEDKVLTATTTIPQIVPVDSVRYVKLPEEADPTLRELRGFLTDIPGVASYYRYFTQRNAEPLYPGLNSVIDDVFFDGQSFEFPITRGQGRTDIIDFDTFGYFWLGDTVTVKFCTIDQKHYDFWNTLEFNTASDGPFSSFTKVQSNVDGGLGVWGGYGVSTKTIVIE